VRKAGFTLIECLIGMALSLLIIVSSLQFFGQAQKAFFRLKEREEAGQSALAALDKMRVDLLHAGRGLAGEMAHGLIEAVRSTEDELLTTSFDRPLTLSGTAHAGDVRLLLASTADISSGQEICFRDGREGELRSVKSVEHGAVILEQPLERDYSPDTAALSLLENVAYFLDGPARILRRRVNAGSAQPLLENAAATIWNYDPEARLVRVRLELSVEGARPYETTVFLKNPALAGNPGI
jgi:prepilin-type N-terminal cleavage/methylation domain-containing protein